MRNNARGILLMVAVAGLGIQLGTARAADPPKTESILNGLAPDVTATTSKTGEGLQFHATGNGEVRLLSAASYDGPVVITARAKTNSTNIRLYFGAKGVIIFDWENGSSSLRIREPRNGALTAVSGKGSIPANEWATIKWTLDASGCKVEVNGMLRGSIPGDFSSLSGKVGIGTNAGAVVTVKSLDVAYTNKTLNPPMANNTPARGRSIAPTRISGGGEEIQVIRKAAPADALTGDKPKLRPLTEVRGLVVSQVGTEYHGEAIDIIALASHEPDGTITIRGEIGQEMQVSIDEAIRLLELRHPESVRASIQLSFGDKYSPKDGGSAGTAFELLMLSAMGDFELNPDAAITGDITIDSKIRAVGEVPAKVHGAALDKAKLVAIPDANTSEMDDSMLLKGAPAFWETQIFSIRTLDDAIAVMRKDPDPKITEAMKLFDSLKADYGTQPVARLNVSPAKETLAKILELAPNHVSALDLQLLASGKGPKRLGAVSTVRESLKSLGPILGGLSDMTPHPEYASDGAMGTARRNLNKLRGIGDTTALPVIVALDEFCVAYSNWSVAMTDIRATPAQKQITSATLQQKSLAVQSAIRTVVTDSDVIDQMIHQ